MKEIVFPCYYLPGVDESVVSNYQTVTSTDNDICVDLCFPVFSEEIIATIIGHIKINQAKNIASKSIDEIIEVCHQVAKLWLNPGYYLRQMALEILPVTSGFSREMIEKCITEMMRGFQREECRLMLDEELGNRYYLDGFIKRKACPTKSKAFGPAVTAHVFSGNVPALPALSILCSILLKSAILGKVSMDEPVFAVLLAKSIAEVSPELASGIAIVYWEGGNENIEAQVFSKVDAVVAYGGNESIEAIRNKVPVSVNFVRFGHKLSFGIIGREMLTRKTAPSITAAAAIDVSMFDQQGCLSPHLLYIETGGELSPREFAQSLALAMERINQELPRGKITLQQSAVVRSFREKYEIKDIKGVPVAVISSKGNTDWTVIYEESSEFTLSCLNRVIMIQPITGCQEVIERVRPLGQYLQTVGVALTGDKLTFVAEELGRLGATRITPLGQMAFVSGTWHHDGRYNLLDLVRWVDLEFIEK